MDAELSYVRQERQRLGVNKEDVQENVSTSIRSQIEVRGHTFLIIYVFSTILTAKSVKITIS